MAEANPILPCVLLPMQDCQLLLPNVSLAEVVDYATPQRGSQGPDWYLGRFSWRGISLPVISYDAANGATPQTPDTARGRIAVLNTIGPQHEQLPFLAVVTQGIPRLAKVDADALR
ncbi:MAG: chemotaxis protein CheW, partial [Gammaproteobacteria bacterium]|nr:chemotaxis protein CheW [Gammaproteobacteria bacterium]